MLGARGPGREVQPLGRNGCTGIILLLGSSQQSPWLYSFLGFSGI